MIVFTGTCCVLNIVNFWKNTKIILGGYSMFVLDKDTDSNEIDAMDDSDDEKSD